MPFKTNHETRDVVLAEGEQIEELVQLTYNTYRLRVAKQVEISEADVVREKYPQETEGLKDDEVLEWMTAYDEQQQWEELETAKAVETSQKQNEVLNDLANALRMKGVKAADFIDRVMRNG
jgi:hypothetical protein